MRIAFASDDSAEVVEAVAESLQARGHDLHRLPQGQWPVIAAEVAREVALGQADQGVLFCWTGTGTTMAANKVPGVRAALAWEPWIAEGARRWNDANVLVMSLKRVSPETALAILDAWFSVTEPDPEEAGNIARLKEMDTRD